MFWLQNLIIVVISYLISRLIIEEDIHKYLIGLMWKKSRENPSFALSGFLLMSYFFSIFLSNTVVIIAFIPIIKMMVEGIANKDEKSLFTTNFVLALIYGANIGGMASLTGSAFNVVYLGFLEINDVPGRENVNFFTWLMVGIPVTLVLLAVARLILKIQTSELRYDSLPFNSKEQLKPKNFTRQIRFTLINIAFIFILSGLQFWLRPVAVLKGLNPIDIIFILYFVIFVTYVFIYPTEKRTPKQAGLNISYLILFILLSPIIIIIEVFREIRIRFRLRGERLNRELDNFILNVVQKIWGWIHREEIKDLRKKNKLQLVSINRLIYDLPFFGLFFIMVLLGVIYFVLKLGDDPATSALDGYVYLFLKETLSKILLSRAYVFTIFLTTISICIFLSEAINNATVIIIMLPVVLNLGYLLRLNPIFLLLAVTISCCAAFMTPIGTNINAIAYASLEGVRLRRMIAKGFLMNTSSLIILTALFYTMQRLVF